LAGAACAAIVALLVSLSVGYVTRHRAQPPMAMAVLSRVEQAVEDAMALKEKRDYPAAYRVLKSALETYPQDSAAGQAQRLRAELAFAHLHWYPEAYEDYKTLAESYKVVFRSSVESVTRLDLLAEARAQDYASLYALDAARRDAENTFAQLEQVIARYPGTFVASAAAEDMARLAVREVPAEEVGGGREVLAMERARDRCTNPVAWAQLSLELGHIYCREMNAPGKARELYDEAAESEIPVLAQLAKRSLAELGSDGL
jgi:tetratricopeptide (TPR) repeat protein